MYQLIIYKKLSNLLTKPELNIKLEYLNLNGLAWVSMRVRKENGIKYLEVSLFFFLSFCDESRERW